MRAWDEFLVLQERELGKETVAKWLTPLKVVRFDACNLYLEAEDSFKALWFEEHMRHRVKTQLLNNNKKPITVHISLATPSSADDKKGKKKAIVGAPPPFQLTFDALDEKAQFSNFVTSKSNLLAFKLLAESCGFDPKTMEKTDPTLSFNPIFLFGRKGTGKTHLMMAFAHALKERGQKAVYVRAETFTEHVVNAIRTGEMQYFRKMYRNVDALIIDDVEIFSRKAATQEELFHTFNTLHVEGKQLILSASVAPQELKFIEPRLISRFEWGIVVPLQTLGKEEMQQLLTKRAIQVNFPLSNEARDFLVETFGANTKSLIRALEALILRTHLNRHTKPSDKLDLAFVRHTLSDLILEEEKAVLTPGKIIRTVAEYYGIRMDDILSKSQSRETSIPRQLAMHLCRAELNLPFMKIGDIFGRDHSTVMTSCKHIQKNLEEKNLEIITALSSITKRFEGP